MEHDFVGGMNQAQRIRNINAIDTVHDFAKGTRAGGGDAIKQYIKEMMSHVDLHPAVRTMVTGNTNTVEHVADKKFHFFAGEEIVPFQQIATDVDHRDYILKQQVGHRSAQPLKRIVIPYSFLQTSLPTWFQNTFSQYQQFVLDVTVIPEDVFCKIPNHALKIQKSLATIYDRVAYNKIDDRCMVEATPRISLHRTEGELLFLSEVSLPATPQHLEIFQIPTSSPGKYIHWKQNDDLQGLIHVDKIIRYSADGKGLTLFGKMIGDILEIDEDVLQEGSRKRKKGTVLASTKKLKVQTGEALQRLQTETSKLIQNLYGLDIERFANTDHIQEYIGILTDFKRMGDLMQIKVASSDSKSIFVTNDIVSSIMASVGYNCPTMRTGRRNAANTDDDTNEDQHSDRVISLFNVQLESGDAIYQRMVRLFTEYLHVYRSIQQKWKKLELTEVIRDLMELYRQGMERYNDTYMYLTERNTTIAEPKTSVNLGKNMQGIVLIYIQQMLIILYSFQNILRADYNAFHMDVNEESKSPSTIYHRLQAFFQDSKLPFPNTLFTTLPSNINLSKMLTHIYHLVEDIKAFFKDVDHRDLSAKAFLTLYRFVSFAPNTHPYFDIVDFPSKSLLSFTSVFRTLHTHSKNGYFGDKGTFMEVGMTPITQKAKVENMQMMLQSMIKENDRNVKHMQSPLSANAQGGYSVRASLIQKVMTLPQTKETISQAISKQILSVLPRALSKKLSTVPEARDTVTKQIAALPEIAEVVSDVIAKQVASLPKTKKSQVLTVAKQIASMPQFQQAITDAVIKQVASSKAKTRKAISDVLLKEMGVAPSSLRLQPAAIALSTQSNQVLLRTKVAPNAPMRRLNTSMVPTTMPHIHVSLQKVNLFDVFLDVLRVKADKKTISSNTRERYILLYFQLSLLVDVLKWNIPIYIPMT